MSEALNEWLTDRSHEVSEGTHANDKTVLQQFRIEFGKWLVAKVETAHLQKFMETYVSRRETISAHPISKGAKRNLHSKLNLFFDFCELDKHYITANPMTKIRTKRQSKTPEEYEKQKDKCFFSEEMAVLLQAMSQTENSEADLRKCLMIEFNYLNGPRISEAMGLRWDHVYLKTQTLYIEYQFNKKSRLSEPKVKLLKTPQSIRVKPLNARSLEILTWFKNHQPRKNSDFVFVQETGSLISSSQINEYLKQFANYLPHKLMSSFSSHALRHSFITHEAEKGTPEYQIMAWVGHANPTMIHTLYSHARRHLELTGKLRPQLVPIRKTA